MKTFKKIITSFLLWIFWIINLFPILAQNPYGDVLETTTKASNPNQISSLHSAIKWGDEVITADISWSFLFNSQVSRIISYVIDIFIVIWIAIAFFWWYKIMTSDKEENMKEWIRLVIFWIIWIIIMISASFLASSLVWNNGIITHEFANTSTNYTPNWIQFADNLYQKILFPFIKLILYFVVWILFFMMVGKIIWFVTATDDSAKKKAWWIIIRCVIWILIIMWSKQIVEAVMWKQSEVLNTSAQRINWWVEDGWMWEEILEFESIPIIAQIINWVMWLTMFIIVVLIIIQWYKFFTKPDDPKNLESLKKTILYILIWVLVIWAAYVISNVLVINNVPITTS